MPNTKSAQKAMRGGNRKRAINLATIHKYKGAVKAARQTVLARQKAEAGKLLAAAYKQLDKAAKKHVIKKNKAARLKSRLARAIAKLQ